jgi:hypothetical protein
VFEAPSQARYHHRAFATLEHIQQRFGVDYTCKKAADSSLDPDVGSQAAAQNVAKLLCSAIQHLSF